MPNTYTQIHIQYVFAVRYRAAQIDKSWKEDLHKYIAGIIQNNSHKLLQINSMPDHIHIFLGLRPNQSISDLAQKIKVESTKWVKEMGFCKAAFHWQEGFGAFSYSKSHVDDVIRYIQNQEQHHAKENFIEEYKKFLTSFEVEWDEKYIFREME